MTRIQEPGVRSRKLKLLIHASWFLVPVFLAPDYAPCTFWRSVSIKALTVPPFDSITEANSER